MQCPVRNLSQEEKQKVQHLLLLQAVFGREPTALWHRKMILTGSDASYNRIKQKAEALCNIIAAFIAWVCQAKENF